jgi:hypothetical protein
VEIPAVTEQEGFIRARWSVSENNCRAKFHELTGKAAAEWEQATAILARDLAYLLPRTSPRAGFLPSLTDG